MRNRAREVVVTGTGVCCHMGDDWPAIESALREGRPRPFARWPPAVEHGIAVRDHRALPGRPLARRLGIDKSQARFMGRAALLALRAARIALDEARLSPREMAVVVGSGTGDVDTHREVAARLARTEGSRRVSPTVIPRLMASTVPANLATVLGATGPSFTAAAACAGGAYNLLLAAQLIESGHVEAALAGGVDVADIHFHAGFDAMRAYTTQDNDRPERASRPYAADRAGFVFSEGAGVVVLETRERGRGPRRRRSSASSAAAGCPRTARAAWWPRRPRGPSSRCAGPSTTRGWAPRRSTTSTPTARPPRSATCRRCGRCGRCSGGATSPTPRPRATRATPSPPPGPIEAIFTLAMLRGGWIAPCVNAEPLDPELLDYPPVVRPRRARSGSPSRTRSASGARTRRWCWSGPDADR